jgi:hypothetical protein
MAITYISRDYGYTPALVRVICSDTLAEVGAPGYLTSQVANLVTVNKGGFTWLSSDNVLVEASDGSRQFQVSSDLTSLNSLIGNYNIQVALTAAQVIAMYATPVLLLGAPGAGLMNVLNRMSIGVDYGSAQYTSGGAILAQYKSTANGAGTAASATLAAATLNAVAADTVLNVAGVASIANANAVNQPLYLSNQTGAFATGDSPVIVSLNYSVIQVV